MKTSITILVIDNDRKNPAVLAIKYLNNITWFENRFLLYKPVYPSPYDTCYDDAMYDTMMTHKYRGSIVVLSISKSVEPNEEQKEITSGFQHGNFYKR